MELMMLSEFIHPSQPGTERQLVEKVVRAVGGRLEGETLERMKTAVSEAVMNAIEHGNRNREELPVRVEVMASERAVKVRVTDYGSETPIPETTAPDIEAMLAGQAKPRGWGLFLIRSMSDEFHITNGSGFHTMEMVFYTESSGNEYKNP